MTEPIPVGKLVEHVCDDGADFNDCIMGYTRASFDPKTGALTLSFERDENSEASEGDDFSSASYKFLLAKEMT